MIKEHVQSNVHPILSISPSDTNDADLRAIGDAIGDSKVVMLGEQDHGDAPAFLAKTRLIKYLHEKKGFRVLAFECDFFSLNAGWDKVPKQKDSIARFLKSHIFGVWSRSDACEELFNNYLPEALLSTRPLFVSGFDCQMSFLYDKKQITQQLDSIIRYYQLPIALAANYQTTILPLLDTNIYVNQDSTVYNTRRKYLSQIREELSSKLPATHFWMMVLNNLIQENEITRKPKLEGDVTGNMRDRQMAENLKWLMSVKYSGEKIIVWAHNFHVSKFSGHFKDKSLNNRVSMGTVLTGELGMKDIYIIGFTSYRGKYGRLFSRKYTVDKPRRNSFESWIEQNHAYAFVDFTRYNKNDKEVESFYLKGSIKQVHKNQLAAWTKIFDGVFYIRDMYPCNQTLVK